MDTVTKTLYKAIKEERLADANKILEGILEQKIAERMKTVLTNQEDA